MPILEDWTVTSEGAWREAIWREQTGIPGVSLQTISLRHPTYPAEADWGDDDTETLKGIVAEYLSKVGGALGLPELFEGSTANFKVKMAWLPLPDDPHHIDPRESFWLTRYSDPINKTDAPERTLERTAVFVAGESWIANDSEAVLGSRMGLRVVAHLSKQRQNDPWHVRITSVARSTSLPDAIESHQPITPALVTQFYQLVFTPTNSPHIKTAIRQLSSLSADTPVAIDGVRAVSVDGRAAATVYATASRPPNSPQALGYALTFRFDFDHGGIIGTPSVEKSPLVAHAQPPVRAHLFTQDPASKAGLTQLIESRPNRSRDRLSKYREDVELEGISLDNAGDCTLLDTLTLVDVRQSRLVDGDNANEAATQKVRPAQIAHPRRNDFAALSGYERSRAKLEPHHLRPLFDAIIAYGLSPNDFFRFAVAPVQVRYRSPIRPGPGKDGKTVNAQVDFDPPECSLIAEPKPWDPLEVRPMTIRFAFADLKRSSSRRDSLGLATDPRWSWHEYCHFLLAARTGRLELHFAHSAGDALAAIASDPWSRLAKYPWPRGYTFPWAYLNRRHDRAVRLGWSWSGRRHRANRLPLVGGNCRHKGYDSEQILSTSLFRLYLALGGDTDDAAGDPDREARQRAADYVMYLILRAIRLMPAHNVSVVETPGQFVDKLIDADIATWPVASGPLKHRAGGWAHKVIRWAFEAQGLYATTNPLDVIDAPGLPPPVDIFIDTGRPDSEGTYTRGGYMPVSLYWRDSGRKPWHAEANSLRIVDGDIWVDVRNRGRSAANDAKVEVWYIVRAANAAEPPDWDPTTWTRIDERGPLAVPPWPAPAVSFGPFGAPTRPAGTRLWILAISDCAADRANTKPVTGLPCSIDPVSIVDLVAGDNNLGLRVLP